MKIIILFAVLVAGVAARDLTKYIVDGIDTEKEDVGANSMISVRYRGKHICGGVIINKEWAITAAKCIRESVRGRVRTPLTVRVGSLLRNQDGRVLRIIQTEFDTVFVPGKEDLGLALIKVRGFSLTDAEPMNMTQINTDPRPNVVADIFGWGKTDEESPYFSENLRRGEVSIWDRSWCERTADQKDCRLICAGADYISPCDGDEGGALIIGNRLVGITLTVSDCSVGAEEQIYANIGSPEVSEWIKLVTTTVTESGPCPNWSICGKQQPRPTI